MKIVLIKYNAGNIQSVKYALDRIGVSYVWTDEIEEIATADKVIFPGVGEASTTMSYLQAKKIDKLLPTLQQPLLGTCVGMQLMCKHSEENNTTCMGIFDVEVKRFVGSSQKVPHVGWNIIYDLETPLTKGLKKEEYLYFVHSFYAPLCKNTVAKCNYIQPFSAILEKDNFYATQFHTEISGDVGETILRNFIAL